MYVNTDKLCKWFWPQEVKGNGFSFLWKYEMTSSADREGRMDVAKV